MLKPVLRFQSRLLIRRAFKPNAKLKPGRRVLAVQFRPNRAGPIESNMKRKTMPPLRCRSGIGCS